MYLFYVFIWLTLLGTQVPSEFFVNKMLILHLGSLYFPHGFSVAMIFSALSGDGFSMRPCCWAGGDVCRLVAQSRMDGVLVLLAIFLARACIIASIGDFLSASQLCVLCCQHDNAF